MPAGFQGLEVYQEARKVRQRIFKLTKLLPTEEKFTFVPQMRKAALSVTNNIAEGHGSQTYKHNISYLYRSRGSMNELLDDLGACEDEKYFEKQHLDDLALHAHRVIRLLNGYIKYLKTKAKEVRTSPSKPVDQSTG
jgi:four helix bundle protein